MEVGTKSNRSWLIALLIISLGLNLLVIGIFVGRIGKGHRPDRSHFDWMAQELNTSSREAVRKTMRAHMHESEPLAKDLRLAQRKLKQVMSAEVFDEQAATAAFALVRNKSEKFQAALHEGMMQTLSQLDRDDRMRVFRKLSMRSRGGYKSPHSMEK
jgi:uncharacterized membrane protein